MDTKERLLCHNMMQVGVAREVWSENHNGCAPTREEFAVFFAEYVSDEVNHYGVDFSILLEAHPEYYELYEKVVRLHGMGSAFEKKVISFIRDQLEVYHIYLEHHKMLRELWNREKPSAVIEECRLHEPPSNETQNEPSA